MKALIAEDDITSRAMLAGAMKKWGYDLAVTEDGAEAWEVMTQPDAPKLVLLDWEMPEMDGLAVIHKIRGLETREPPYIILLTSRGAKEDIVLALKAGANDYVTKPFDRDELKARLDVGRRMVELQASLVFQMGELTRAMEELKKATEDVRTLRGIIPICAHCKQIRDDKGYWNQVEVYVRDHSEASFSHGICPQCMKKLYPDFKWDEVENQS